MTALKHDFLLSVNLKARPERPARIRISTMPQIAPLHIVRFRKYASIGFYTSLPFHRVQPGRIAQAGDTQGDGFGGSVFGNLPLEASGLPFERGSIGMARDLADLHSGDCQFFICLRDMPELNGLFTQFARVTAGMEDVDLIHPINVTENHDNPQDADSILSLRVL